MDHEWLPQTPAELRTQATKLHALATHVFNKDLAHRLEEQAAELFAEAELKAVRGLGLRPFSNPCEH